MGRYATQQSRSASRCPSWCCILLAIIGALIFLIGLLWGLGVFGGIGPLNANVAAPAVAVAAPAVAVAAPAVNVAAPAPALNVSAPSVGVTAPNVTLTISVLSAKGNFKWPEMGLA